MSAWEIIAAIVVPVTGGLSVIFVIKWRQTRIALREIGEVFIASSEAMEDGNFTVAELKRIAREVVEAGIAIKNVFTR